MNIEPLSEDEQELSQIVTFQCGKKTQQLLPLLIAHLRMAGGRAKSHLRAKFDRSMFGIGGSKILVGHPVVPVYLLDSLATSELLIIPHIAASRPNGIWHIERGEQHPLVLAASKLTVWCRANDEGQSDFCCDPGNDDLRRIDSTIARGVELFTSIKDAEEFANLINEEGEKGLFVKLLSLHELLSCLSRVDIATINLTDFAVTDRGKSALGCEKIASTQELLEALTQKT